jgi:hypothetical protein|mmetsp:Transcript_36354/g.44378  ORF Transcript_36354/g.44378 Transcript_36354/m.44378 type:complete len:91 (+) Transcript_36354:881-1153(+)
MIQRAIEEGGKASSGGGDACCGGGGPATPDSYISDQLPKLTETVLEILADEPFNGKSKLPIGETEIKFKGEALLTSILDLVRRVKGVKLL